MTPIRLLLASIVVLSSQTSCFLQTKGNVRLDWSSKISSKVKVSTLSLKDVEEKRIRRRENILSN